MFSVHIVALFCACLNILHCTTPHLHRQNAVFEVTHMNNLTAVWQKHYPNFGSKHCDIIVKCYSFVYELIMTQFTTYIFYYPLFVDLGWAGPAWKDVKHRTRAFTNFHTDLLHVLRANLDRY